MTNRELRAALELLPDDLTVFALTGQYDVETGRVVSVTLEECLDGPFPNTVLGIMVNAE